MNDAIVVALITGGLSLLGSILGIISASKKQTADLEKALAVINTEITDMKEDIRTHNQYAKMFSENIPAINQHMKDVDRRLEDLERGKAS